MVEQDEDLGQVHGHTWQLQLKSLSLENIHLFAVFIRFGNFLFDLSAERKSSVIIKRVFNEKNLNLKIINVFSLDNCEVQIQLNFH